ncbi:nSTAND1 domain-containing NTPase [Novosphingobium huizhouense]|uniref:nSTAND1 domain-containing NTPase n=1 Tax=Novosphingobium huizhouense TaxID=2866625 RepID=UPI001CD8F8B0|nr:AAA family ATPase [Novosphingobium huizhouense]
MTTADLFAGRHAQITKLLDVISERGRHAIIYGEPGVGKTSLSQIIKLIVPTKASRIRYIRKTVFSSDTFSSIWMDIFRDIKFVADIGEGNKEFSVSDLYPREGVKPADVVRELSIFSENDIPIIVIDEFNLIRDQNASRLMAETIKALSDEGAKATVVVVGISDSVADLIDGHQSITRCTEEILMPRMDKEEMRDVVEGRIRRLGMEIEGNAKWKVINLTKGLPAFAHGLGKESAIAAISKKRLRVLEEDVDKAIDAILNSNQNSLKQDYENATHSNQARARYRQILMACALAQSDEVGYFTPKQVVDPLSSILGKDTPVDYFNDNLKEFTEEKRGRVLYRQGSSRIYRYRFRNPAMQPYVIMKGIRDGFLGDDAVKALASPEQPDLFSTM